MDFMKVAKEVAKDSKCLRRKYGAIIVKDGVILSAGTNNVPGDVVACKDIGVCLRQKMNIPRGTRYEACMSVHAEQRAIIALSREQLEGSVLYLYGEEADGSEVKDYEPCCLCKRAIIEAGIDIVYTTHKMFLVKEWEKSPRELMGLDGY